MKARGHDELGEKSRGQEWKRKRWKDTHTNGAPEILLCFCLHCSGKSWLGVCTYVLRKRRTYQRSAVFYPSLAMAAFRWWKGGLSESLKHCSAF